MGASRRPAALNADEWHLQWLTDGGELGSWRHDRADRASSESKLPHWGKIRGFGAAAIAKRPPSTIRRPGAMPAYPARSSSPMLRELPGPPSGAECHLSDWPTSP